jgi:putative phage-type endonuclease
MAKTKPSVTMYGTARKIGDFENNSPEWHALRAAGIGGSDVAGIVGVSPWASPFKVWATKTGRLDDTFNQSEAMEWGTLLEPVILEKFQREHPEFNVIASPGTWAHIDRPWQLANPDAIYVDTKTGESGIVEIKTARYEDDWVNGVPLYYQTQVQWYCSVFGFTAPIIVVVLFSGSKYREFTVEPDTFAQDLYVAEVEKFLELVRVDEHPDFDGSMATLETVRQLHPEIDPEADCELGDLGIHYFNAVSDLDEATAKANELKARVLDAMGNAKRGLIEDRHVLTRQSRNGGTPFLVAKRG